MRTLKQLQANLKPGCYLYKTRGRVTGESIFIIVFRLVRDVVANHKTTRYAGAATKVIQKNHLA